MACMAIYKIPMDYIQADLGHPICEDTYMSCILILFQTETDTEDDKTLPRKRLKVDTDSNFNEGHSGSSSETNQNRAMSTLFGDVMVKYTPTTPIEKAENEMQR